MKVAALFSSTLLREDKGLERGEFLSGSVLVLKEGKGTSSIAVAVNRWDRKL